MFIPPNTRPHMVLLNHLFLSQRTPPTWVSHTTFAHSTRFVAASPPRKILKRSPAIYAPRNEDGSTADDRAYNVF